MRDCDAMKHGTTHAYIRYGCGCPSAVDAIRAAWRASSRRRPRGGRGRPGPASGFDPMAVERACAGDRTFTLTPAETRQAVDVLTGLGLSAGQIAIRLGVSPRTVVRHRTAIRKLSTVVSPGCGFEAA